MTPIEPSVRVHIDGVAIDVAPGSSVTAALARTATGRARHAVSGAPRAPFCGMGVCHECRVQVDGVQQLACMTPCREGQHISTAQAHLTLPAAPAAPRPPQTCDILVVGAGPAGLQAALTAAPGGARITVLDANPAPGGQVWRSGPRHGVPDVCQRLLDALARQPQVTLASGARVVGLAGPKALLVETAEQGWVQHFDKLILCTGARELLLPFAGWTLPGVTGAGGLQALIKQGVQVRGQRIVIAGTGPLLLASAATARRAGAQVVHIAEQAPWRAVAGFAATLWRWPTKAWQAATLFSPAFRPGHLVQAAHGIEKLASVTLRSGNRTHDIACERLACGFGLVPNTQLAQLLGCALDAHGAIAVDEGLQTTVADIYAAGECTGVGGNERAQLQGRVAGRHAAGLAGAALPLPSWNRFATLVRERFALQDAVKALATDDTLVCRCEDVPLKDLVTHAHWMSAKLQTRCGMGACQGRICGASAQALWDWRPTPPRQLIEPTRIATLACATTPGHPPASS